MQSITPVTIDQLLQKGKEPLLKLEIFIDPYWVNICDGFSFLLSDCDADTDWTGTDLSIDTDDKKEGTGSLKDTVAVPAVGGGYYTQYNPTGSWDWSAKKHILFWLKCDRASTAFTSAYIRIYDTSGNYRGWNLTFSAGEWTAFKSLLSTGDFESGTPPNFALIERVMIRVQAADVTPFYKKIDHLRIDDVAPGLEGKTYLESINTSHGGAEMSPNPTAASLSAEINNKDAIFHPKHPTSAYVDYFKAGRKVKISIGATYDDVDYYWQRIIGYMDIPKFSDDTFKINISGLDYTKVLIDTKFRKTAVPPDNYWGALETLDSVATTQYGAELYIAPGGDAAEIALEDDNVLNWAVKTNAGTTITSEDDIGGFSDYEIEFIAGFGVGDRSVVWYQGVCAVVAGTEYYVTFKFARTAGDDSLRFTLYDGTKPIGGTDIMNPAVNGVFETASFSFTPEVNEAAVDLWLVCHGAGAGSTWRVDNISIKSVTSKIIYKYQMPEACMGIFYVELDEGMGFLPVWPGRQKDGEEGWFYDSVLNQFYFAEGKIVDVGTNNLRVYYFTQQIPENVVADLLVMAGFYVDQAAALAGMEYTATGITIDKVWFEAGSKYLDAIKMLCERCDYRFHFKYDGTPVFRPFPTAKAEGSEDLQFRRRHIVDPEYYEDRNEIKNRIVIEGLKQALPEGADETMPSELKGEAHDDTSIAAYLERTLSIKNRLFQDLPSITAMCATLLARYKDPKWYFDFNTPYQPAPLEIWDTIRAELLLKCSEIPGRKYGSFKYDSGVKYGSEEIAVLIRALIRDIKIDSHNITYKCEEVT